MPIIRFIKNWTLPIAMLAGALSYFIYTGIPALEPTKPYVARFIDILQPALIFAMLFNGGMIPTYLVVRYTGLLNTFWAMILPRAVGAYYIILMMNFMKGLPEAISESAFIDGAGDYVVFFKIMLPMAIPGLVSVAILSAIGVWNDYFTIYMFAPSKVTIAVGLQGLISRMQYKANYPLLFAAMIMSIIPVIAIFSIFQKTIMQNTTIGGVKG